MTKFRWTQCHFSLDIIFQGMGMTEEQSKRTIAMHHDDITAFYVHAPSGMFSKLIYIRESYGR